MALIRLRGCAGWSAPLLFANPRRQVFLLETILIIAKSASLSLFMKINGQCNNS